MKTQKFEYDDYIGLKETVGKINNIDTSKLSVFLHKILEKCVQKNESVFTTDEEAKLIPGLCLRNREELHDIVELCKSTYEQAVYHLASTSLLKSELSQIGFTDDKVAAFSEAWGVSRKDVMLKAREVSLSQHQLTSINWSLSLVMAKDALSTASSVKPSVTFDLGISSSGPEKREQFISLEFDHAKLYHFYEQLETIQCQLDSLTN